MAVFHEFIYQNSLFQKEHTDFTGDSDVTVEQRRDFLEHYATFLERCYHVPMQPQKVVGEEELERVNALLCETPREPGLSRQICFDTMSAFLKKLPQDFRDWRLYTRKVQVREDTLIFASGGLPPTAAAVYQIPEQGRLRQFHLAFYMDSGYQAEIAGGIMDTTPGRTVELRHGIHDLVKLQFYSNGSCYVRLGNECPYHLKNIRIGQFDFDCWQKLVITLTDTSFSVVLNDRMTEYFPLAYQEDPDMMFIDCGMLQAGEWCVRPLKLITDGQVVQHFFARTETSPKEEKEILGTVELPYRAGGYANRDKTLILEQEFELPDTKSTFKKAVLIVDSLDPGGLVYLNGCCIADMDSFETLRIDVTEVLQEGRNRLKILVNPRAPEVLFGWHRQEDPYNGWFCETVELQLFHQVEIRDIEVFPLEVNEGRVRFRIRAGFDRPCQTEIYLKKIFPEAEPKERKIGCFDAGEGMLDVVLECGADAWSPEEPNLYMIRVAALGDGGAPVDEAVVETGFRTISQEQGELRLNGKPFLMTGALCMQFLPPHAETSVTHICPRTEQILEQELMVKHLNGNTMRMHVLGYGTNDKRYARLADRLGLLLIWTTRYIDSLEHGARHGVWEAREGYVRQIKARINHPSIIIWEGANEYHPSLADIDHMYNCFVPAVKEADPTRLICPISHLYYAGDIYPLEECGFYNDSGTADQAQCPAEASVYWRDSHVIRSAHTYAILLGYGNGWKKMRCQEWSMQQELLESADHAYIVSEFAVIGRQDPGTPEAEKYFKEYSYEFPDDDILGFRFRKDEWRQSQAYQALAAKADVQAMRLAGVDGMLWCCLMGGANDGGYLKPVIDCYGYPKLAYHTLKEGYQQLYVTSRSVDVLKKPGWQIHPVALGTKPGRQYQLEIRLCEESGELLAVHTYPLTEGTGGRMEFPVWEPPVREDGYYEVQYCIFEKKDNNSGV